MEPSHAEKSIIAAASCSAYHRVFFLGPFARRVSFASQQNRVLNLVWALHKSSAINAPDKIAVVGGGLSGLTACVALANKGYQVHLLESGTVELHRQRLASHRFVHPTVNDWPNAEPHPTTQVPYFDWFSDSADKIMELLAVEWKERSRGGKIEVTHSCTVLECHETAGKISLETNPENAYAERRYDAVLVTSGFKDEHISGSDPPKSYWRTDDVEYELDNGAKKFVVSGCGDGGLIDTLRIAHKKFRHGELIVDVAEALTVETWSECEAVIEAESTLATNTERPLPDALAKRLQDCYEQAARNLPEGALRLLGQEEMPEDERSLRFEAPRSIRLLSRQPNPYCARAAPIHKLLVAHAINNHVVEYLAAEVEDYTTKWIEFQRIRSEHAAVEKLEGVVLIRHGAAAGFEQLLKNYPKDAEALKAHQQALAEDLDRPIWRTGEEPLVCWPPPEPPFDLADLKTRLPHAEKIMQRLGLKGKLVSFDVDSDKGFVIYAPQADLDAVSAMKLPSHLFGIPLSTHVWEDEQFAQTDVNGSVREPVHRPSPSVLCAGAEIVVRLNGRLGPIVVPGDASDSADVYSVTVAHLLWPLDDNKADAPVFGTDRRLVGVADKSTSGSAGPWPHLCLVRFSPDWNCSCAYGPYPRIGPSVQDKHHLFGARVVIVRRDSTLGKGRVTSTRTPIQFRHFASGAPMVVSDAIRISPDDARAPFSVPGDSGAPVVTEEGALVGLVVSSSNKDSFVAPIGDFLRHHSMRILSESVASGPFTTTSVESFNPEGVPQFADLVWNLAQFNRTTTTEETIDCGEPPSDFNDE